MNKRSKCGKCNKPINMKKEKRLAIIWASYFGEPNSGRQGNCYLCASCYEDIKKVLPFL